MDPYALLATATGFDWDDGNATKNWTRHRVSAAEVEQVFFNAPLLVAADDAHSDHVPRLFALGQTDAARRLFVAFTLRGALLRPISARDMSRRERTAYAAPLS